jgi:ribosomal protein S18 acetylase RimI-like enzyme
MNTVLGRPVEPARDGVAPDERLHHHADNYTSRNYRGQDDLGRVLALWLAARASGAADPWPALDTLHQELVRRPAATGDVQLWEDPQGRLVGAALLLDGCMLVQCTAVGANDEALQSAMIAWGLGRARCTARAGERPALFVPAGDGDERLAALLRRCGLHEDAWRTLRLARSLRAQVAPPRPAAGVVVRAVAGERDLLAAAALHATLFGGGQKGAGERAAVMAAPGYRPGLDLVAALGDGAVVGYALGTCCVLERERLGQATGWLEFIGVDREQRGRGIGRALTLHLLRAMAAEGIKTVWLTTGAANVAARRLFEACGFVVRHEVGWYVSAEE